MGRAGLSTKEFKDSSCKGFVPIIYSNQRVGAGASADRCLLCFLS